MPIVNPTLPSDGDDAIVSPYNTAIQAILGVLNGSIDSDNLAAGAVTLSELSSAIQATLVPTGLIAPFGGSAAPTGWLMCDGASYLRASFSTLFASIGTNYGSADGTHFNVPDFRGRIPVGSDTMGSTAANRIQVSTTATTTNASPGIVVASAAGIVVGQVITAVGVPAGTTVLTVVGTSITMSANATASGSGVAARFSMLGNDAQVLGAVGGESVHTLNSGEMAHLTYTVGTSAGGFFANFLAGTSGATNQAMNENAGGVAHNNVQPSIVTNYIIKT